MSVGFFCYYILDETIHHLRDGGIIFFAHICRNCYEFYEKSVDSEHKPRSAASDLSLHYLSKSFLLDNMHE